MALEFRCKDAGVVCNAAITADSQEELIRLVKEHAEYDHGVLPNQTLVDYAMTQVRSK